MWLHGVTELMGECVGYDIGWDVWVDICGLARGHGLMSGMFGPG